MKSPFLNEDEFFKSNELTETGDLIKARGKPEPIGATSEDGKRKKIGPNRWVPIKGGRAQLGRSEKDTKRNPAGKIRVYPDGSKKIMTQSGEWKPYGGQSTKKEEKKEKKDRSKKISSDIGLAFENGDDETSARMYIENEYGKLTPKEDKELEDAIKLHYEEK